MWLTALIRSLVITSVFLGSAAAALAAPRAADAAGAACPGAAATVLTLPSGATGGSVTVRTPSGFAGSVRRADGSDVPAVWTAGSSGGYSVTALSLADGQTDGYVAGANSARAQGQNQRIGPMQAVGSDHQGDIEARRH